MSTQQINRPQPGQPRPGGAPSSAPGGGGGVSFDPLKLLQKYKYVLVGAIIAGSFVGAAGHVFFLKFFPGYKSTVLFECTPVETEIAMMGTATIDEDEMSRFIGTQVATVKGERVILAVLQDARLESQAPKWYKRFASRGSLDIVEGYKELEDIIKANAIPNTYLIQLSVQVRDPSDAAGLVRLVKENYLRILSSSTSSNVTKRKEQIRNAISNADETLKELNNRKNRLVQGQGIGTTDVDKSAQAETLVLLNAQIINLDQQIEAYKVLLANDEAQLQRNTGIQYDSILRERVEQMPQILTLKQQIIAIQAQLLAFSSAGIQPDHRSYKLHLGQLEANERKLADTREELLSESFNTRIDSTRMALSQYRAQIAKMMTEHERYQKELNDLTTTSEELKEIDRQIESVLTLKQEHDSNLAQLSQSAGLDSANRILINKTENVPDRPAFPIFYVMIPAGIFLITALTAGALVVFEMLDQRVKSAADIAMIPRTKILGVIPDASEDPVSHTQISTVFMDSPNSVLAEQYRQLRTRLNKSMLSHGHKSLLVAGAMPGSGATSVACNIAQASVASGLKTLVIDTNFRRATVHTAFGLPDTPGLAELLAGEKAFDECIQKSAKNAPHVLAAGSHNMRVVERLGTDMMGKIIAQACATYDLVIIDVAPAIVAGDALTLSNHVDATMLVVRAMSEKRGQVARLKNELSDSRAEFLGVLVNGVRSSAGGYMRKNIRTSHQYHSGSSEQPA